MIPITNNYPRIVLADGSPKKCLYKIATDPFIRIIKIIQALFLAIVVFFRFVPKEKKISPSDILIIADTQETESRNKRYIKSLEKFFGEIHKHPALVSDLNDLWHQSKSKMLPPPEFDKQEKLGDPIVDAWGDAKQTTLNIKNLITRLKEFYELNPTVEGKLKSYNVQFSLNDF